MTNPSWEKTFDELFKVEDFDFSEDSADIKTFIHALLKKDRVTLREKVAGMKKILPSDYEVRAISEAHRKENGNIRAMEYLASVREQLAHNAALQAVIDHLSANSNEK